MPITFRSFCLVLSCIYPVLVNPLDLIPPRCHIPAGSRGARGVTMLEYEDFCIEEWRKAYTWFEKVMFSTSKDLKNTKYNKLWPWRRLILLAEILASNKSPLCRIASLAFIFFKFLLQVTSGISISRLEIRQERISRFYLLLSGPLHSKVLISFSSAYCHATSRLTNTHWNFGSLLMQKYLNFINCT